MSGGSPSIVSWWTTRPVSTSNSSWTQRSGPVGVGSSKGVAISDDGSSKGLFTLFWMARSAAVSPRMRQRSTAGRGGAGGAATVLPPRRPCASMFSLERSPGERTPPEVGPWPFKFASGTNENALTALSRAAAVESLHLRCRTRYLTYVILP